MWRLKKDENRYQIILGRQRINDLCNSKEKRVWLYDSAQIFQQKQSSATSINLRDIEAIAKAQDTEMWRVLREFELHYLK